MSAAAVPNCHTRVRASLCSLDCRCCTPCLHAVPPLSFPATQAPVRPRSATRTPRAALGRPRAAPSCSFSVQALLLTHAPNPQGPCGGSPPRPTHCHVLTNQNKPYAVLPSLSRRGDRGVIASPSSRAAVLALTCCCNSEIKHVGRRGPLASAITCARSPHTVDCGTSPARTTD